MKDCLIARSAALDSSASTCRCSDLFLSGRPNWLTASRGPLGPPLRRPIKYMAAQGSHLETLIVTCRAGGLPARMQPNASLKLSFPVHGQRSFRAWMNDAKASFCTRSSVSLRLSVAKAAITKRGYGIFGSLRTAPAAAPFWRG